LVLHKYADYCSVIVYYYSHFVIFAAVILLLAMLGSIILTLGLGEKRINTQSLYLSTRRGDLRLKFVL
jgi:hypothetical protein